MKYMGGKSKIAKDILPIILANRQENQTFVDICCGGAGILDKVANPRIANDINEFVVALLKAVSEGWVPPENLGEQEYYEIKANWHKHPKELVCFAAICCSYAGKWWGGYARGDTNKGIPRNYAAEQSRHLVKQGQLLRGVEFYSGSYENVVIPPNSIVYADIPYFGTTQYKDKFDYVKFWQWADTKVNEGHKVFVSEYSCPLPNWSCVWSKEVCNSLTKNTGGKTGVEKLFTRIS